MLHPLVLLSERVEAWFFLFCFGSQEFTLEDQVHFESDPKLAEADGKTLLDCRPLSQTL